MGRKKWTSSFVVYVTGDNVFFPVGLDVVFCTGTISVVANVDADSVFPTKGNQPKIL